MSEVACPTVSYRGRVSDGVIPAAAIQDRRVRVTNSEIAA